jgi:Cft2 family RNA processing exonuclease
VPTPCDRARARPQVKYAPFSAHTDARGILTTLEAAAPRAVVLVHGEAEGMQFLAEWVRSKGA